MGKEKCRSAVNLAIAGAVIGFLFLPSIGVTLAISGLIVNHCERKYYNTEAGLWANLGSLCISICSWIVAAALTGLL